MRSKKEQNYKALKNFSYTKLYNIALLAILSLAPLIAKTAEPPKSATLDNRTNPAPKALNISSNILTIDIKSDANLSQYIQIQKLLRRHPNPDPIQASLQQALLQRLIALLKKNRSNLPPDSFLKALPSAAQNSSDLENIAPTFLKTREQLNTLKVNIERKERELEALEKEIQEPFQSQKNPLTLRLQYLYTREQIKELKRKLDILKKSLKEYKSVLLKRIESISIDSKVLQKAPKRLKTLQNQLKAVERNRRSLQLERERLQLLKKNREELARIDKGIVSIDRARDDLFKKQLKILSLLYGEALKRKSKKVFEYQDRIDKILKSMGLASSIRDEVHADLMQITRKRLGVAATIQSAVKQELSQSLKLFWKKIHEPLITIGETPINLMKLSIALIIFLFGISIGWFYKRAVNRIDSHSVTQSTRTLLGNLGYYLIVIISFFSALNFLGISLTSIALVAGALSVGIGFGLQNIVSNFVSGIILMFERSIKIGDYVELDDNLRGRVTDIRMRSVTINTNANIDIIVPNQQLIENRVINWTMNDKIRRFEIPFGVAYGTPAQKVIRIVLEAVGRSRFQDIYTDKNHHTRVIMTEMADNSVNFLLFVWIKGNETLYPKRTVSRFLILIYTALNDAGIEIPFPQRDLHLRSVEGAIPVRIEKDKKTLKEV